MTPSAPHPHNSSRPRARGRRSRITAAVSTAAFATALLTVSPTAQAAIVPTVSLGTAAGYSVLGGQTVTNTGPSTLNASLGVSPGTSVTGFPPGTVNGTTQVATGEAQQAQSDLTAAYIDAAGRPLTAAVAADLVGLTLQGGVFASSAKGPLQLSGQLVLDAEGDPNTVFIFQTDSTLTTGSGSSITLINGAQACNVFWQVGSSATLGTGSSFVGNVLALSSVTVTTGATVQGRALARNAAITLDTNTFVAPSCNLSAPVVTTTPNDASATTVPGGASATTAPGGASATTAPGNIPGSDLFLPRTGRSSTSTLLVGVLVIGLGLTGVAIARRRPAGQR